MSPSARGVTTATLLVLGAFALVKGVEFTIELPDSAKECFHEQIRGQQQVTLEFQVIMGGQYDVDMELKDPNGNVLYSVQKKSYESHTWTSTIAGEYTFCFSNEFSTFTHKLVYFDLQVGDNERPLVPGPNKSPNMMTMMERAAHNIHKSLSTAEDYQTHYRLREAKGRAFAESLHEGVQLWSVGETVLVLIVGVGQVLILRSFFAGK